MVVDEKFTVYKSPEFDKWYTEHRDQLIEMGMPDSLGDAVVIRTGDLFARGVLFNYVNSIETQLEVIDVKRAKPEIVEGMRGALVYMRQRYHEAEDQFSQHRATLPD